MTPISKIGAMIIALTATLVAACTARIGDLTIASTKEINLAGTQLKIRDGKRVHGKDCEYHLLYLFPTGIPNLQQAVDDALNKGSGNLLIDQVSRWTETWLLVATRICLEVEGTALTAPEGNSANAPSITAPDAAQGIVPAAIPPAPTPAGPRVLNSSVLRAQPRSAAAVQKPVAAGTAVVIQGSLDTADGHWYYVNAGGAVGWINAAEIIGAP